jgi:hypothetical protein
MPLRLCSAFLSSLLQGSYGHGKREVMEKAWKFNGLLEVMEKVIEFLKFDHLNFLLHHKILHFVKSVYNFGIQFWVDRIFRILGSSDLAQ